MKNVVFLLMLLLMSCSNDGITKRLSLALDCAGENRSELEQVLAHYSTHPSNSLKYRAAVYLIENMPYHNSSVVTPSMRHYLDQVEVKMDSVKNEPRGVRDSIYDQMMNSYDTVKVEVVEDIKVMTAQYLIDNIEQSFDVWENQKWAQHLSFEEFCELILPYKVFEGQILDDWKAVFYKRYNHLLAQLDYRSIFSRSSFMACQVLNQALHDELQPRIVFHSYSGIPSLKTLLSIPFGTCDEYSIIATAVMRANGIPVGMDFTPQWPTRNMGHVWNFVHDNQKNDLMFEGGGKTIELLHKKDHHIMAKAFRYTYKINPKLEELIRAEKHVPPVFLTPFIEDITSQLMTTIDIDRNITTKAKYAYLAVFDDKSWAVTAWGENKKGKVSFKSMGKDVLYLPVKYTEVGVEPVGEPFIVTLDDQVKEIKPDTLTKQSLSLVRKYPINRSRVLDMNMRKIGAKIQAANNKDFSDSVTFHLFSNLDNEVNINPDRQKYRYWRVLSNPIERTYVAELLFFGEGNHRLQGEIIGTEGAYSNMEERMKEAAFDGDLLTFFDPPEKSGGWVGMDFKDSVAVSRVACMMRGDGNDIEIGNEYELFYWMEGQWISLGKKVADDIFLEYENCPMHALFLLRNRTKGEDERIFTYENDKQVWW